MALKRELGREDKYLKRIESKGVLTY